MKVAAGRSRLRPQLVGHPRVDPNRGSGITRIAMMRPQLLNAGLRVRTSMGRDDLLFYDQNGRIHAICSRAGEHKCVAALENADELPLWHVGDARNLKASTGRRPCLLANEQNAWRLRCSEPVEVPWN
jgi:hypothetical protein